MKKAVGVVLGLLPVSVRAQCITPPDCALIGYTETSCEGDSLKCPFDTTKLYCPPCDSSYKYSCSGENVKNPIGDTCNNKYAACECIVGATFSNGECICDTSCSTVGNIYYSDGTCSSCLDENKIVAGVVVISNVVMNLEQTASTWAIDQLDAEGNVTIAAKSYIPNLPYSVNGAEYNDYNGVENTLAIVNHFGENATGVAAVFCYNYAPNSMTDTKTQWYLPAGGEIFDAFEANGTKIKNTFNRLSVNVSTRQCVSTGYSLNSAWTHYYNGFSYWIAGNIRQVSCVPTCFLKI